MEKKNRQKIDNKYQKAKIKNLKQSLEFQKYNVEEKKVGGGERKEKKRKRKKITKIILKIYMKFDLKKQGLFCKVIGFKSENERSNRGLIFFFLIKDKE